GALPFAAGTFDYVVACLLLHHFEDREIVAVLGEFRRVARRAVLISDLQRHWLLSALFRVCAPVFARNHITYHDGIASIHPGFQCEELGRLAASAGFPDVTVRRHLPWFRMSLVGREPRRILKSERTYDDGATLAAHFSPMPPKISRRSATES